MQIPAMSFRNAARLPSSRIYFFARGLRLPRYARISSISAGIIEAILLRSAAAVSGLVPSVEMPMLRLPSFTSAGNRKLHAFLSSTTLTRMPLSLQSLAISALTPASSDAAMTKHIPVKSDGSNFLLMTRMSFFSAVCSSSSDTSGATTVKAAPYGSSFCSLCSAIRPPPAIRPFFPPISIKKGKYAIAETSLSLKILFLTAALT